MGRAEKLNRRRIKAHAPSECAAADPLTMPTRLPLPAGTQRPKVMTPSPLADVAAPCLAPVASSESLEQLRALNHELSAMNTRLRASLEQQQSAARVVRDVLYRLPVPTLVLDAALNIRLFTPAIRSLFNLRTADVGRPLADLRPLATDPNLVDEAKAALRDLTPLERAVQSASGVNFIRRISPCRLGDDPVDGVVITFIDIDDKQQLVRALATATQTAERTAVAQSRFLAATSHDLRQPLQTLKLLQGLLLGLLDDEQPRKLTVRIGETVGAMAGMLNAVLDVNHLETAATPVNLVRFRLSDLLDRLADEFSYKAGSKGLKLKWVPCRLSVESDPRLLEQILRTVLANALQYTNEGRILLGCRRHGGWLSIEVRDTGIGMPAATLHRLVDASTAAIDPPQEPAQGLVRVRHLCRLLGHQLRGQSQVAKGSAFCIDVALSPDNLLQRETSLAPALPQGENPGEMILIVEDDLEVLGLLGLLLKSEGYQVAMASDALAALEIIAHGGVQPDLILADYNLPGAVNGLQIIVQLRRQLHRRIPAIILTGDISRQSAHDMAFEHCTKLNKPAKLKEIIFVIATLLTRQPADVARLPSKAAQVSNIFVIDDDPLFRQTIRSVLEPGGYTVLDYPSCRAFLEDYAPGQLACLLVGAQKGLELLHQFRASGDTLPVIVVSNSSEVTIAVEVMKAGAADFIEKPLERSEILQSVARALECSQDANKRRAWAQEAAHCIANLTLRQRQVMEMVLAGHPSKNIAAELGISQRTVENHRASIMSRTHSKSIPALARIALAARSEA
ncbi:response regulator [Pseudomonas protegens]|nr:response regulator [Pseudomonas protegens]